MPTRPPTSYFCINCAEGHFPTRKGRCKKCDGYLRKYNRERPLDLHLKKPCITCGKTTKNLWKSRCVPCYKFWRNNGKDRTATELLEKNTADSLKRIGLKRCKKCLRIFDRHHFLVGNSSPGTRRPWCRECDLKELRSRVKMDKAIETRSRLRRRARKFNAQYEDVKPIEIFERDNWTCQICGCKVDRTKTFPYKKSPSLDHIIPLSKGGPHTRSNCQCACLACNLKKRAKIGNRGNQLRCF